MTKVYLSRDDPLMWDVMLPRPEHLKPLYADSIFEIDEETAKRWVQTTEAYEAMQDEIEEKFESQMDQYGRKRSVA